MEESCLSKYGNKPMARLEFVPINLAPNFTFLGVLMASSTLGKGPCS